MSSVLFRRPCPWCLGFHSSSALLSKASFCGQTLHGRSRICFHAKDGDYLILEQSVGISITHVSQAEWREASLQSLPLAEPGLHSWLIPVPHIQDFASSLASSTVFSKVYLIWGHHQVPVAVDDVCKTTITTSFGLYKFVRMPFGLRN